MATVLVVEDDASLGELYRDEFGREGYDVEVCNDGPAALETFSEFPPDVVILDIRMPGMDGIETLTKLLSKDRTVPLILNTAYPSYKDNFMSWAAEAYVIKSSDLTELKRAVRRALENAGAG